MASIRKHGEKWQVTIKKKGHKTIYKSFTRKADAERYAKKTEISIETGEYLDTKDASRRTLGDIIEIYLKEDVPKLKSIQSREYEPYRLNNIKDELGTYTLDGLKSKDVADYVSRRLESVKSDTVRRDLTSISNLYKKAIKLGIKCVSPITEALTDCEGLEPGEHRDRRLTKDEYTQLTTVKHRYKKAVLNELIIFAVETAMRQAEISRMEWRHIDLDKKTLYIPETKTKPRTIGLSSKAIQTLESLPKRKDGYVWGKKPATISQSFTRLCKRLNIKDCRFDDLRHEGTSRLFELGLTIPQVAVMTGHADWRSLKRYTTLKAEDIVALLG